MSIQITNQQARLMILKSQGLIGDPFKGTTKDQVNEIVRQLTYVQIDTLSVAERAHHHVIHTRAADYSKEVLFNLLSKEQSIFEYWSHAASYLPMEDFRFSLPRKYRLKAEYKKKLSAADKRVMKYVLDAIKSNGPMQSKDFERKGHPTGPWFDYKPTKMALERLFWQGTIMIEKRINFQKVYNLPERILSEKVDTTLPSESEISKHIILNAIKSQGLATIEQITYLRKGIKEMVKKMIGRMVGSGELMEVAIENVPGIYYTSEDQLNLLNAKQGQKQVHILSPFDNLVIQRKRIRDVFNFEYNIECYVPEPKRKFGYYVLPVLFGDQFVARFDPKADRKTGVFKIKKLFREAHFRPDKTFNRLFDDKINQFAEFCGCKEIRKQKVI